MGGISIPNLAARLTTGRLFHALQCRAGVPACPIELGADCVVLGPVPVLSIGPRFNALINVIIATIVTATTRATVAHPNKLRSVDVRDGGCGS